jgi:hypothetical protein
MKGGLKEDEIKKTGKKKAIYFSRLLTGGARGVGS